LKILEKSLNLSLKYVENLHLITILMQTLVCISPELAFRLLVYWREGNLNCQLTLNPSLLLIS